MTTNLFENKQFFINTVSSIWNRYPFIISCSDEEQCNNLVLQLIDFIPAYRQLVGCGNVPRNIEFSQRKPRILDSSELKLLCDSLSLSFEEEQEGSRPIQLVYFDATEDTFSELLGKQTHGWFATTHLSFAEIGSLLEIYDLESVDDCTILFLKPNDNIGIEQVLFDKSERRSLEVASFIYQLKMSEVNLIGNAILKEIENGKNMTAVEIKELFDIDDLTLDRVISLLNIESKINVKSYITFTPKMVQFQLKQCLGLNGVILAGAMEDERLIGLAKERNINFSVTNLFNTIGKEFYDTIAEYNFGENTQLIIEIKDGKKILFVLNHKYVYTFLIDTTKNINILTDEILKFVNSVP